MKSYFLFFLCCLFTVVIQSQTFEQLENEITSKVEKVNNLTKEYNSLNSKYVKFSIAGKIEDRNEDLSVIFVRGTAIPMNEDFNSYGTLIKEGNIIVQNPDRTKVTYDYYVRGEHYLIEKRYGKNVFGGDVPAFVYGDFPNYYDKDRMESLSKSISSTKNEIAELREKKRQIEIKILTKEAEALFSNNELEESILKYQSLVKIDFQNAQIYNDKIASMYSTIADKKFSNNEYESAISYYNKALSFNQQKKYEVKKAETYQKIAENEMNLEKYTEAISNFDQVITLMPEKEEIINPLLANAYFNLGKNDYTSDQRITAVSKFKKSHSLDGSLKIEIEPFLSSMRRTPLLYGAYSIIPGLGQLLQGKNSKGITQFSLFSASIVGGFIFNSSSKDSYSKYEKAVTSEDTKKLYKEANDNKLYSNISLGVSAGIIIWSVIDSFLEAGNYNEPFYLSTTSLVNYNVNIAEKSYQLSISFNF